MKTCPTCGSPLREHTTKKGAVFLTCSRWPACRVSGTPELLERVRAPDVKRDAVPLGSFIVQAAQLAIHVSRLRQAKTAEERAEIRRQALEALNATQ